MLFSAYEGPKAAWTSYAEHLQAHGAFELSLWGYYVMLPRSACKAGSFGACNAKALQSDPLTTTSDGKLSHAMLYCLAVAC